MPLFDNFSNPKGLSGRLILNSMNLAHSPISKWGLSQYGWKSDTISLDIGCGGGMNIKRMLRLAPKGYVTGVDISSESVEKSRNTNKRELGKRCRIEIASAENLPFDCSSFDLATAFETIYFWNNIQASFTEILRVLKPNGTFMAISEISKPDTVWTKVVKGMTVRTPEEIKGIMLDVGFVDIEIIKEKSWVCIKGRKAI